MADFASLTPFYLEKSKSNERILERLLLLFFILKKSLKRNPIKMGSEIYFFQNLQNCIFSPFGLDYAKNNYSLVPCYMVENK